VLEHLNLLKDGGPTNAAVLLFGKEPQRFLISSEVKCAHFHGTAVRKPIPFYQVYKGTAFDLVDRAVDLCSPRSIWPWARGKQHPGTGDMNSAGGREKAIVNAVAHRDYTSNGRFR
jgi:predicted HTH transcriptional regulator